MELYICIFTFEVYICMYYIRLFFLHKDIQLPDSLIPDGCTFFTKLPLYLRQKTIVRADGTYFWTL